MPFATSPAIIVEGIVIGYHFDESNFAVEIFSPPALTFVAQVNCQFFVSSMVVAAFEIDFSCEEIFLLVQQPPKQTAASKSIEVVRENFMRKIKLESVVAAQHKYCDRNRQAKCGVSCNLQISGKKISNNFIICA